MTSHDEIDETGEDRPVLPTLNTGYPYPRRHPSLRNFPSLGHHRPSGFRTGALRLPLGYSSYHDSRSSSDDPSDTHLSTSSPTSTGSQEPLLQAQADGALPPDGPPTGPEGQDPEEGHEPEGQNPEDQDSEGQNAEGQGPEEGQNAEGENAGDQNAEDQPPQKRDRMWALARKPFTWAKRTFRRRRLRKTVRIAGFVLSVISVAVTITWIPLHFGVTLPLVPIANDLDS